MDTWKHGKTSTYTNKGCRCEECREAVRKYQQSRAKNPGGKRGRKPSEIVHGTQTGYYTKKCRCEECTEAAKAYQMALRNERSLPEGDPRHGTSNGYTNFRCRCDLCRKAVADYNRESGAGRKSALKQNYGITPEEWDDLFQAQGGVCASCGDEPLEGAKRRFHVDHCHTSGAVRGILCHGCNVALGYLKDDSKRIQLLAGYIDRFNGS